MKEKTLSEKIKKISDLVDYDFEVCLKEYIEQFIKEILDKIKRRKKYHMKQFNLYIKETKKYADDKKQVEYLENQAIKEMNINDELKEVEQFIKQKAGFEDKNDNI